MEALSQISRKKYFQILSIGPYPLGCHYARLKMFAPQGTINIIVNNLGRSSYALMVMAFSLRKVILIVLGQVLNW